MAVVDGITLQAAYSMWIVAGRAWRVFFNDVFAVFRKALITQDAVPAVTLICCLEIMAPDYSLEEKLKAGAMRTSRPKCIIGVMTVSAGYDAGY